MTMPVRWMPLASLLLSTDCASTAGHSGCIFLACSASCQIYLMAALGMAFEVNTSASNKTATQQKYKLKEPNLQAGWAH